MSSTMPHTQRLLSQWTYNKMKLGTGETFLPSSTISKSEHLGPPQLRGLSADGNADWLLGLSDLRWRYRTANCSIKDGPARLATEQAQAWLPASASERPKLSHFPHLQGEPLSPARSRVDCIICKILCWYCKWGLIAAEAPFRFLMQVCGLW